MGWPIVDEANQGRHLRSVNEMKNAFHLWKDLLEVTKGLQR